MRPKVLSILVLVVPATLFAAGEVDRAKKLYTQMNYREAIQALAPVASSGDPVVHEAFCVLASSATFHEALDSAGGEVHDLLHRLAVEDLI